MEVSTRTRHHYPKYIERNHNNGYQNVDDLADALSDNEDDWNETMQELMNYIRNPQQLEKYIEHISLDLGLPYIVAFIEIMQFIQKIYDYCTRKHIQTCLHNNNEFKLHEISEFPIDYVPYSRLLRECFSDRMNADYTNYYGFNQFLEDCENASYGLFYKYISQKKYNIKIDEQIEKAFTEKMVPKHVWFENEYDESESTASSSLNSNENIGISPSDEIKSDSNNSMPPIQENEEIDVKEESKINISQSQRTNNELSQAGTIVNEHGRKKLKIIIKLFMDCCDDIAVELLKSYHRYVDRKNGRCRNIE